VLEGARATGMPSGQDVCGIGIVLRNPSRIFHQAHSLGIGLCAITVSGYTKWGRTQTTGPWQVKAVYAGPKEKDKSMEYLKKAYEDRSVWLVWLRIEKIFDFLRSDPRFQDLQRRVGLPPPN
jgi:hypothetical protein